MDKLKALYLEDDEQMHHLVLRILPEHLDCMIASSIEEAKILLEQDSYHLIMVDLFLKDELGFTFIEYLNNHEFAFHPSVLIITGSESEEDEIRSHESNVLEFIRKPLRPQVFKAQIEKYLRRFQVSKQFKKYGPLYIDENRMELKIRSEGESSSIPLTLKEYQLLVKFINKPGIIITREELYREVWNTSSAIQSRTIDMHVSALRKKLGPVGEAISSVRGMGYAFNLEKVGDER